MWNNGWFVACFIISIICCVISLFSHLFSSRKTTLVFHMAFDFLSVINMILLYQYDPHVSIISAAVVDGTSFIRDIVYYFKHDYKWAKSPLWMIGFIVIVFCSLIFSYSSPISLIIVFGGALNTVALYLDNKKYLNLVLIAGEILFITYFALLIPQSDLLTVVNMIISIMFFVSATIGLIRCIIKEKKDKQNECI